MTRLSVMMAIMLALTAVSCAGGPQPIVAGDPCARCHMPVADERWGAELVTRTGVIRKYDAIECLARDLEEGVVDADGGGTLWVVPFDAPGTLVPAADAVYVRASALRSPMGLNLAAFSSAAEAEPVVARHGGSVLDWAGVRALVASDPATTGHATEAAHAH